MRWLAAVASVWAGVLAAMSLAPSAADASQPAIVLPLDQEFGDPALWELVGSSPPGSLTSADGARRAGVGASVAGLAPHHHARLAQVATDLALYGRLSQADPVAVAWCEGLAFGALIHASRPSAIDAPPTDLVAALDEEVARRRLRTLGGFLGPLVSRETLLWDLAAQVAPSAPEPLALIDALATTPEDRSFSGIVDARLAEEPAPDGVPLEFALYQQAVLDLRAYDLAAAERGGLTGG